MANTPRVYQHVEVGGISSATSPLADPKERTLRIHPIGWNAIPEWEK